MSYLARLGLLLAIAMSVDAEARAQMTMHPMSVINLGTGQCDAYDATKNLCTINVYMALSSYPDPQTKQLHTHCYAIFNYYTVSPQQPVNRVVWKIFHKDASADSSEYRFQNSPGVQLIDLAASGNFAKPGFHDDKESYRWHMLKQTSSGAATHYLISVSRYDPSTHELLEDCESTDPIIVNNNQ